MALRRGALIWDVHGKKHRRSELRARPFSAAGIGVGVRLVAVSPVTGVLAIVVSTLGVAAALLPWNSMLRAPQGHSGRRR